MEGQGTQMQGVSAEFHGQMLLRMPMNCCQQGWC